MSSRSRRRTTASGSAVRSALRVSVVHGGWSVVLSRMCGAAAGLVGDGRQRLDDGGQRGRERQRIDGGVRRVWSAHRPVAELSIMR